MNELSRIQQIVIVAPSTNLLLNQRLGVVVSDVVVVAAEGAESLDSHWLLIDWKQMKIS